MSFGTMKRFRHNDMQDLERVLSASGSAPGKLVVVDGVFSMEGDIAKLPEIVRLAKKYGARIMVDDAHAVGVLGRGGRGTAEHYGIENEVDIIMGTCSKSLASIGGFVVGRADVIDYLKHFARTMIFSASLPPASVAAISAAIDIIKNEPERREQLWKNTHKMQEGFKEMGYNIGVSETPIVPLQIGDDDKVIMMRKILFDNGIFANPILPPATPPGRSLIRTSYMATHTEKQLDIALEAFEKVGKKLGVIKGMPDTYYHHAEKAKPRLKARIGRIRKGARINVRKITRKIFK